MKKIFYILVFGFYSYFNLTIAAILPFNFVYLNDIEPSILQEIRYAGSHNFIGRPIKGYFTQQCILTQNAALALKKAQKEANKYGLTFKVYDCYRPQMAVNDFYRWSKKPYLQSMKEEFYPRVPKEQLFHLEYIALYSGHSRGSTIDLTLVPLNAPPSAAYYRGQPLVHCYAPYSTRFQDNSIDMGTSFDCMDNLSHLNAQLSPVAEKNRHLLQQIMQQSGFKPYTYEWWHFTLVEEPYPNTYFNFPVQ